MASMTQTEVTTAECALQALLIRCIAPIVWKAFKRLVSNPPKILEEFARNRMRKIILDLDCSKSRLGTLGRWIEIQYIDFVIRWSGGDFTLTVPIDNPKQVDRIGVEEYFHQKLLPVSVCGDFDTNLWTVEVKGDMDDVKLVKEQIDHAVERNRLRPGQMGITRHNLQMDLS